MSAEENAYEILGLQAGPAATDAEIKKAYRKLALIKHPDKNPDNPNAADEFSALQRAYELLLDPEARAALDGFLKARSVRAEKTSLHDEKRRRMAANLERRERAAEQGTSVEDTARAKLQMEIERLRKAAALRAQNAAPHPQVQQQQARTAPPPPPAMNLEMAERLTRTLKVSWSRDSGEYTSSKLRQIFEQHGPVEDVVLRDGKKKKKSALVVMATVQGAVAAGGHVNGNLDNPLLVVPLVKGKEDEEGNNISDRTAAASHTHTAAAAATAQPAPTGIPTKSLGQRPIAPLFAAGTTANISNTGAYPQASLFTGSKPSTSLFPGGMHNNSNQGGPAAASSSRHAMPAAPPGFSSFTNVISSMNGSGGVVGGQQLADPKYEDSTLTRLRQEAERKRLIAQMKEESEED